MARVKKITSVTLALATLFLVACSQTRELHEMHDATTELNQKTTNLGDKTGEMYDQLKQGDSVTLRELLLGKITEANEVPRKISLAAKYFMSFEFQIWSGLGQDSEEKRWLDAAVAAREFMADIQEYIISGATTAEPFAQSKKALTLNVIAVAMDMVNPKQEFWLGQYKSMKRLSIYSMIKDALAASTEIEAGRKTIQDYPQYVREVLVFPKVAEALLQARYNFFGVMTLGRISTVQENWFFGEEYAKSLRMYAMTWATAIDERNTVEIREISNYLAQAIETRDFMRSVGLKPNLNYMLWSFLKNAKFTPSPVAILKDKVAATMKLIENRDDYVR